MTETLFPCEPVELAPRSDDSPDVRRRKRADRAIANGQHPFGGPLREPAGETCRTCVNAKHFDYHNRSYWKCPTVGGLAHSAATDLRLKWPACVRWEQGVR